MKKILMMLMTIFIMYQFFIFTGETASRSVFKEREVQRKSYFLDITLENITSIGLEDTILTYKMELLSVTPSKQISLDDNVVEEKLQKISFYSLKDYVTKYCLVLHDYGLENDIEKISVYGIRFDKVYVMMSEDSLRLLKADYPLIKSSETIDGNYS